LKNIILNEDCRHFHSLHKYISYDYIFTVPPDYDELNLTPHKDDEEYRTFLKTVLSGFIPRKNVCTIAITDRKFKGGVIDKHNVIINIMSELGWRYISQKIWCKSYKLNLYRLNYTFVMTFGKGKIKQHHTKRYEQDIWNHTVYKHNGYDYSIALGVVKRCIENFTNESDIVYDPFMGSGTTAVASHKLGRYYVGCELNRDYYDICFDRIKMSINTDQSYQEKIDDF